MRNRVVTKKLADQVWDILVAHCGANTESLCFGHDAFVRYAMGGDWTEFRFGGTLGSGGKVYYDGARIWVACYREDSTPERARNIDRANAALRALHT